MESELTNNMFENKFGLSNEKSLELIKKYFQIELPNFKCYKFENLGMFYVIFHKYHNIDIQFWGDRGELNYKLFIQNNEIPLLLCDPQLKLAILSSEKNITYVFNVLKHYLEDNKLV